MANFFLTFEDARQPSSPGARQQHMSDYRDWLAGMGDTLVMPQLSFRQTRVVTDQEVREVGPGGIMGFPENMEAAIAVARQCPFPAMGTMRVAEAMDVPTYSPQPAQATSSPLKLALLYQ